MSTTDRMAPTGVTAADGGYTRQSLRDNYSSVAGAPVNTYAYYYMPGILFPVDHSTLKFTPNVPPASQQPVYIADNQPPAGVPAVHPYHHASEGRIYLRPWGDFMGSWGVWRRQLVAAETWNNSPDYPFDPEDSRVKTGRIPPAVSYPCGANIFDSLSTNTLSLYRPSGYNKIVQPSGNDSTWLDIEVWLPKDWAAPSPNGNPVEYYGNGIPNELKPAAFLNDRPAYAQLKTARPAKYLVGDHLDTVRFRVRPFSSMQRNSEGSGLEPGTNLTYERYSHLWSLLYWHKRTLDAPCDIGHSGPISKGGRTGQNVVDGYADPHNYNPATDAGKTSLNAHSPHKCFSINALNPVTAYSVPAQPDFSAQNPPMNDPYTAPLYRLWTNYLCPIGRMTPGAEGTFAVLDELKISSKDTTMRAAAGVIGGTAMRASNADWSNDRVAREMASSRYFLPPNPQDRADCPTFTSQSLLQSRRNLVGPNVTETVLAVRVSWSVFTPRFMHEYKTAPAVNPPFTQTERHTSITETAASFPFPSACRDPNILVQSALDGGCPYPTIPTYSLAYNQQNLTVARRGPFHYDLYNDDSDTSVYSVHRARATGDETVQPHASRGVEVELLNNGAVIPGSCLTWDVGTSSWIWTDARDSGGGVLGTFYDPNGSNRLADTGGAASANARVRVDQLQYRVRFRYPVDASIDTNPDAMTGPMTDAEGNRCVNRTSQLLLDTPVLDEVTVIIYGRPVVLDFRYIFE